MTDYQTATDLAAEQAAYNAHLSAANLAELEAIWYAEATAENKGFSPVFEDAPEGYFEDLAKSRAEYKAKAKAAFDFIGPCYYAPVEGLPF